MPMVWVLAPRSFGPILVRQDERTTIDAADQVLGAMKAGPWIEPEWTPVPAGDQHWVRTTTGDGPWEIIEMPMDPHSALRIISGQPGSPERQAHTQQWLDTTGRQQWLAYRLDNPEAANWLPPIA